MTRRTPDSPDLRAWPALPVRCDVLSSERVALVYFAYLALAACVIRMPARTRLGIVAECAGTSVIVFAVARLQSSAALTPWTRYLREWMPLVYLLWFYWIPAHFTSPSINRDAERWLADADRRWAAPVLRAVAAAPRALREFLELAYLLCYPMLPAGLAAILWRDETADPVRYGSAVLLAGALSYGVLPWLRTRPPRELEDWTRMSRSSLRRLNELVLHRASVQLNTLPSGHVATATAAALTVVAETGLPGVPFVVLAAAIALACVAGRYHYLADVVLGAAAGLAGFIVARQL